VEGGDPLVEVDAHAMPGHVSFQLVRHFRIQERQDIICDSCAKVSIPVTLVDGRIVRWRIAEAAVDQRFRDIRITR